MRTRSGPLRRTLRATLPLLLASLLPGCQTSPPSGPGTSPTCALAPNQNGTEYVLNCTLIGSLPNSRFDPFAAGSACSASSHLLFNQTITTPISFIYGQGGEDDDARVRVGGSVGAGTHLASLGKDGPPDCTTIVGPTVAVSTSFTGQYVSRVDKGQNPMCIYQSRLVLSPFTQTIGAGLSADISELTRARTQNSLLLRMDLETATAVNGYINAPALPLSSAFVARSGRCPNNGWVPFLGP